MPMLDVHIPDGALDREVEDALIARLTDLLLEHEGADPRNEQARGIAWVWLHRPARTFVAGAPAERPRYKLIPQVPEGQYNDERRAAMVAAVTEAVLDAEEAMGRSRDPMVVWVFPTEIPDGNWGAAGRIFKLGDIAGYVMGSEERGRRYADEVLAERRSAQLARA